MDCGKKNLDGIAARSMRAHRMGSFVVPECCRPRPPAPPLPPGPSQPAGGAAKAKERRCVGCEGSGNARQGRCLGREGSGNARQRRCLNREGRGTILAAKAKGSVSPGCAAVKGAMAYSCNPCGEPHDAAVSQHTWMRSAAAVFLSSSASSSASSASSAAT